MKVIHVPGDVSALIEVELPCVSRTWMRTIGSAPTVRVFHELSHQDFYRIPRRRIVPAFQFNYTCCKSRRVDRNSLEHDRTTAGGAWPYASSS
jgi:hypothetical protein